MHNFTTISRCCRPVAVLRRDLFHCTDQLSQTAGPRLVSLQANCRKARSFYATVARGSTPQTLSQAPSTSEQVQVDDPFGHVEDVMTETGLKATTGEATVASVTCKLDTVSGLPVVDSDNTVLGVITRKDIIAAKEKGLNLQQACVRDIFSAPAVTVRPHAHISEAAGIMLARKLNRLPVTDTRGRLQGIVSRTDVMQPILQHHGIHHIAAVHAEEPRTLAEHLSQIEHRQNRWQLQYLYDGGCPICRSFKATLASQDRGKGNIMYVDIANPDYDPEQHGGIAYEQAMKTIHAIRQDKTIVKGPKAVRELYAVVGYGWASKLADLPGVGRIVDWAYEIISKNRLGIGNMDGAIAMRKLQDSNGGPENAEQKQ